MSYLRDKLAKLHSLQVSGIRRKSCDLSLSSSVKCLNCGHEFSGKYCPCCGQKADTTRLSLSTLAAHAFTSAVSFDRGFLRTCLDLFYRPGYLIRDYIQGRRADYSKPLQMLFVLATVYVVVHYICFQTSGLGQMNGEHTVDVAEDMLRDLIERFITVVDYIAANNGLSTLIFVSFLVLPNWLVFKLTSYGKQLNVAEHCYIMLFVGCQLLLLHILEVPYSRFFHSAESMVSFASVYTFLFAVFDFKQLYQIRFLRSFWLLLLSSVLAVVLFLAVILAILALYMLMNPNIVDSVKTIADV